jgi:uncharacterized protein (TIGR02271 family)
MDVYSEDGEKLGKIVERKGDRFLVEKGLFFPKASVFVLDDIADIRGDDIYLRYGRAHLADDDAWMTRNQTATSGADLDDEEELRVPLAEEELEIGKTVRDIGEVRVHKRVIREQKQVTVPVMREEVRVERVPAANTGALPDDAFEEGTISVPVREEEVEIRKRPVVKEEVRVGKHRQVEERTETAEVRREEAEIDDVTPTRSPKRRSA